MAKVFPTFSALVRHFSSVDSPVLSEVVFATEGFSTFTTLIRSFSGVDPLVLDECGFAAEGFSTFHAVERLFSTVDPLVLHQGIFTVKTFPTLTTLIMDLPNMKVVFILSAPCYLLARGDLSLGTNQTVLKVPLLYLKRRKSL